MSDLEERRAAFGQFYQEMLPVLVDFVGKIGINPAHEVLNHAVEFAPWVANALDGMEVCDEDDRLWLLTRLGYFVGEYFAQKYKGCWYVEDRSASLSFARYVVGRFDGIKDAVIDPFEIAKEYVDSPLPRQLQDKLATMEKLELNRNSPTQG